MVGDYPFGFGDADLERYYPDAEEDVRECGDCLWRIGARMLDGTVRWICAEDLDDAFELEDGDAACGEFEGRG